MDLMIAAHALQADAVLITNNTKHFSKVTNLKLENWVSENLAVQKGSC
jgi:tRNA(fMet)-specific endonuclease VapC